MDLLKDVSEVIEVRASISHAQFKALVLCLLAVTVCWFILLFVIESHIQQ